MDKKRAYLELLAPLFEFLDVPCLQKALAPPLRVARKDLHGIAP
jgi:hypothetical protein